MGMIRNQLAKFAIRQDVTPADFALDVRPPARSATGPMNLSTAVGLVPMYRSIQILAIMMGGIEFGVRRRGEWIETPSLAAQPDAFLSRSRFLKRTTVGLAGTGNAYWLKIRDAAGAVISYRVLNPLMIRKEWDTRGRMTYVYTEMRNGRSTTTRYQPSDIRQLKLLEVPGYEDGLGPIQACRLALEGHRDVRDFAATWFKDSGVPNGVLTSDQQLSPDTANAYREAFTKSVENHGLAVLGYGMHYDAMMLKPADAQWLENQQFGITDTARLMGLPASYLDAEVNGSSMTYQNIEQVDTKFNRTTFMGYVNEIEDAITADLPRGQEAKGKLGGLLRSDNFTRAKINALYIDKKVLTPEQVANDEGYAYEGTTVNA